MDNIISRFLLHIEDSVVKLHPQFNKYLLISFRELI